MFSQNTARWDRLVHMERIRKKGEMNDPLSPAEKALVAQEAERTLLPRRIIWT